MTDAIDAEDQFQNYVDNKIYGADGWKLFRSYYNDYSFFDYSFYPCNMLEETLLESGVICEMSPANIGRHFGMIYADAASQTADFDLTPSDDTPDTLRMFNIFWYE